jgi:hypothetical protein
MVSGSIPGRLRVISEWTPGVFWVSSGWFRCLLQVDSGSAPGDFRVRSGWIPGRLRVVAPGVFRPTPGDFRVS